MLKSFLMITVLIISSVLVLVLVSFKSFKNHQVTKEPQSRPNVIVILADDMGYSDLGCYGGEAQTPNLDKLAANGLRYTQFYNMTRCCPSRAALLTGLYPHQTGMGWMTTDDYQLPGYRGNINKNCVTMAEALKENGYATYMTGKWHLNFHPEKNKSKENWPLQRGFEKYYGIILGAANYYDPGYLCRDNILITPQNDTEYKPAQYYFTDAISDNSVKYIQDRDKQKPFFMYVAYTAPHWPLQAPEEVIQKYKGRFDKGWEKLREERLNRMKSLGVISKDAVLSASDGKPWAQEKDKPAMIRRMETYSAMIDVMDQGVGRIINTLKQQGIYNNTVILFLQDNGACAEMIGAGEVKPVGENVNNLKAPGPNDLTFLNNPPITRQGKLVMQGKQVIAGPADTYVAYLKDWANVSNTPFRLYKHDVNEGGISTPLIIHWPEGIKNKGAIRSQIAHEIDILPTILDITKTSYPKLYNDNKITPMAGISLVPTFSNKPLNREAIFWEHEMNKAVRMGKWKLLSEAKLTGMNYKAGPWELYDIDADRSEEHNLAASNPVLVEKMIKLWETYAHKTQVYPSPWTEIK